MKKAVIALICSIAFFFLTTTAWASDTELLTAAWNFVITTSGDSQKYQSIPQNSLNGKESLRLTYDLNGACILGGDASAIIFDQPVNQTWRYVSLSNYGQNCYDGEQVVTIPLSDFSGLNTANAVGTFHGRFWLNSAYNIVISSAVLVDAVTPTPTPTNTPTPTPTPIVPSWPIQSLDAMKVTKDVVCTPYDQAQIDAWLDKVIEIGGNYVALSQPYDNPACGNAVTQTGLWVSRARAKGLHVWHRHQTNSWEGTYSFTKKKYDDHLVRMAEYIEDNPTFFEEGDIFTPFAEPQNGGINGLTFCANSVCQFGSKEEFNQFIRTAQKMAKLAFIAIGFEDGDIKVGYWGFDGFLTWGDNNIDHQGTSKLEASTVTAMDNLITIDHYPASGASMSGDLDEARAVWPSADFFIGEWGTIGQSTATAREEAVVEAFDAFVEREWIKGVNYWHGCCGGNESLWNSNGTNREHFDEVESYFK